MNAENQKIKKTSTDELDAGLSIPAVFVNKVSVTTTNDLIRITFFEGLGGEINSIPRTAVLMYRPDVINFYKLLNKVVINLKDNPQFQLEENKITEVKIEFKETPPEDKNE